MNKKMVYPILLLICILLFVGIKLFADEKEETKKELFKGYKTPIVYHGKIFSNEAKIEDDVLFLPHTVVEEVMDASIYIEEKTDTFTITTEEHVFLFDHKNLESFINNEPFELDIQTIKEKDIWYIPSSVLEILYPYSIHYDEKESVVYITEKNKAYQYGVVIEKEEDEKKKKKIYIREKATNESSIVSELKEKEEVIILKEENGFYFIQRKNGYFGYVDKKDIVLTDIKTEEFTVEKKVRWKPIGEKVNLTWEAVYGENPDVKKLKKMPGVNVVSPTWFTLVGTKGKVSSTADMKYVRWAHQQGYQVWALFSNDFQKPNNTHEVLSNAHKRKEVIRQLVAYSKMYDLDGINIDFENIYTKDKQHVVQFVKELTPYLHELGMVVSMDITFISDSEMWSKFYDRKALSKIVDYMIVMAYDEHWASSSVSGSVSSIPWVESNLKTLLKEVPKEKLILGVPFYMRVWEEKGEKVSSSTLTMKYLKDYLKNNKLNPTYDKKTKQNYVEFKKNGNVHKLWIEDEVSMKHRVDLVKKYDLAGIASWNRGFSTDNIWKEIDKEMKKQ